MRLALLSLVVLLGASFVPAEAAKIEIPIVYLEQQVERPPTLSNLDPVPENLGLAGAELGISDNATTGRFLGHSYALSTRLVPPGGDFLAQAREALSETGLLVVNAPAEQLLALADLPEAKEAVIFNAAAQDVGLRGADCRPNLFHTISSYAMRADGLAQLMRKKGWSNWALIAGSQPADAAFAEALRGAARKYGLKITGEKTWRFDADLRRNAAQEVPAFTQDLEAHDVLVVADELGDFGRYILYNTWEPRPVAGSEGLAPRTWAAVVEQWGAAQLQSRFFKGSERDMRSEDYAAWAAVRSIGEAVTRTGAADVASLRGYILSDDFELAGFKGRALSFRKWNGQLRQPMPLVHPRALVGLAPLEGFLHQTSELDTLGLDAPESACRSFGE